MQMLNKIGLFFVLLFLHTIMYANNTLTEYRKNGIVNIEKKLDFELTKTRYWKNYLKDKDNTFGYLEKYPNVLTCNKKEATLNLYMKNKQGNFFLKKKNSAYIGEKNGDKQVEGDLKTPVGVYRLTKKKDTNLDPFYGPLALVTSYPNTYDKYLGKTGHGIWIHGLPTAEKRNKFTKGCIAIQNQNLKELAKQTDVENTILIINENKESNIVDNEILSTILAQLYKWRFSWLYNNVDLYLSFYSKKFVRADGMNFADFKRYKKRVFKKIEKKTIIFNNINVIPYPNKKDLYQITFKEYYKSNSFEFSGDKVLMIKLHKNNRFKILTEK